MQSIILRTSILVNAFAGKIFNPANFISFQIFFMIFLDKMKFCIYNSCK